MHLYTIVTEIRDFRFIFPDATEVGFTVSLGRLRVQYAVLLEIFTPIVVMNVNERCDVLVTFGAVLGHIEPTTRRRSDFRRVRVSIQVDTGAGEIVYAFGQLQIGLFVPGGPRRSYFWSGLREDVSFVRPLVRLGVLCDNSVDFSTVLASVCVTLEVKWLVIRVGHGPSSDLR